MPRSKPPSDARPPAPEPAAGAPGPVVRAPNPLEQALLEAVQGERASRGAARRLFAGLPSRGPRVLQGPAGGAGVVDVGGGLAVALKLVAAEPAPPEEAAQAAAGALGAALQEVLAAGARPIAALDSLRFGAAGAPGTAARLRGAVRGLAHAGSCAGIPVVGGEVQFDAAEGGGHLLGVLALGLLKSDRVSRGAVSGAGNPVLLLGARTGRDRPPAADPFAGKVLLEACLELFRTDALLALEGLSAGGLAGAAARLAGRTGSGFQLDLDRLPAREVGLTAQEQLLSETPGRALAVVRKGREAEVAAACQKWDLACAPLGRVAEGGRLLVLREGRAIADLPLAAPAPGPGEALPPARPAQPEPADLPAVPVPADRVALEEALRRLLSLPALGSAAWVHGQVDHLVRLGTALRPGEGDAAVVRFTGQREGGVALSVDGRSRWVQLDPRLGAAHAAAEAARNVSCAGGEPVAFAALLALGDPALPEVQARLAAAGAGLAEASAMLGVPVVACEVAPGAGGPAAVVVGAVGAVDDCGRRAGLSLLAPGEQLFLLGEPQARHLGGSEYLRALHGLSQGRPPPLDLARERAVQGAVRALVRAGLVRTAHDVGDGGLLVALAGLCFGRGLGLAVALPPPAGLAQGRLDALLFGEDAGRVLVACAPAARPALEKLAAAQGAQVSHLGAAGGDRLVVKGPAGELLVDLEVAALRADWAGALPRVAGEGT